VPAKHPWHQAETCKPKLAVRSVANRQTLHGDDAGVTALAPLAHHAHDRLGGFPFSRTALGGKVKGAE